MRKVINKISVKDNLAETICLALIFYIVLIILGFLISIILSKTFRTSTGDIASVVTNMFVWSATLITPIIAIILVNSWKTQKKFEIEKEYASLVLNDIHPILIRIIDLQSMYLNIKDINQNLVLYEKYTIQSYLQIRTLNLKSFSNIKIFSKLTDNIEILNKYYSLDHHLIYLENHLKSIHKNYSEYMSIAKKELPERFEPTPPNSIMNYPNNKIRSKFSIQINLIRSILKQQIDIKSEHISNGETTVHGTYNSYEEMLNKTKILIEDIQDIAFESIKVR